MATHIRKITKLLILVGLPGSGKSTFVADYTEKNRYQLKAFKVVDFDHIRRKIRGREKQGVSLIKTAIECGYAGAMFSISQNNSVVILDGLFLTNADYEMLISAYADIHEIQQVEFHYWTPDVEACLWNDRGRRYIPSEDTIRGLKVEKPNIEELQKKFSIPMKIIKHTVVRKPEYVVFSQEHGLELYQDKYLKSTSWSLGGECWGWDGEKRPLDAEEPCEFAELDDFLMDVAPNLTFLQYKKLRRECVSMKEVEDNDYYSSTTKAFWVCDVEALFNLLEEWGYSIND